MRGGEAAAGTPAPAAEAEPPLPADASALRFLRSALELTGASVWRIDLATERVHFNAAGFEVVGMRPDPEGVPLAIIRDSIHPQDRPTVEAAAREAAASERVVDAVARYRTAQGGWRTLLTRRIAVRDAQGRACALLGVALDLSGQDGERARADGLAARTQLVAHAVGVGFWQREGDSDVVVWDAQMYRLYGRDPALAAPTIDGWIDTYVEPEARDAVRRQLHADIAAWAPETLMTVPVRGDDGQRRQVRAWTRRSTHEGRRIALGMQLDVTAQVAQESLQREAERMARASREKSAFMAMMSHRLRTPLNAVLGFAQLMAQDTLEPLSERQRERLARIDAAGAELLSMIDDVFELATLEAEGETPQPAAVPLEALLLALREAVEPLARLRGVALRWPQPVPALRVATDRRLLGQALRHLAAHAVRRNERGGHLDIAVRAEPPWLRLEVRDGGPRLSAAQRELLFDGPGLPATGADHGDPLVGLDLVRQALERLGAQVDWLHPDPTDSALLVRLPLADEAAPAPAAPPALTVLCIEDNPVNLMLVQELVALRPGMRLLSATDGQGGLAQALHEPPDLVLLDLHLPDLHGREVAARLRADPRTAGCRIVALSAGALPEDIRNARAQGFDDYWTKPIDFNRFLDGLDRIAAEIATARASP